jgi:DNA-binding IclR family transcriptional regulator
VSGSETKSELPEALEDERGTFKSLQKALAILDAVGRAAVPPRIAEAAISAGVSRPTAYRIVQALVANGYLAQDPQSGRLSIGFSVLMLSSSLLDRNRLRLESLPHLETLAKASGERANLGILHQNKVLYLAGVEKPTLPTIYSRFGKTAPAHCSSLGKAIVAHLPEAELRALLAAEPLEASTPHSITNARRFMKELEAVRKQGYAVDREEHVLNSCCVAVPIFNSQRRVVGAIGISGDKIEPLLEHVPMLRHKAELIAHKL